MIENVLHHGRQRRDFGDGFFVGQALQPADFDEDPEANQAVLAEDVAKPVDLVRVTAVGG